MSDFYISFEKKLIDAVNFDFHGLLKKIGNEKIYAISLVIDSDVSGIFLVINTLEYLDKKDLALSNQDNLKEFREIMSPKEIKEMFGDYNGEFKSTKWIPTEWGYGNNSLEHSEINVVNEILSKKSESFIGGKSTLEREIHKGMISSLFRLKETPDFNPDEVVLFISMSDDERVRDVENSSAKTLNSKSIYDCFMKRFVN
jgi:hypothetical protein